MKRKLIFLLSLLIACVFVLAGCGGLKTGEKEKQTQAGQGVITLKVADMYAVNYFISNIAKEFMKSVEEQTNGKVKFEYYPSEQLGKAKDMINLCNQGVADIVNVLPQIVAGQLPLNNVMSIPSDVTTSVDLTEIYIRLAKGILMEEFHKQGVVPIITATTPGCDVYLAKKPYKTLDDLKGLKIRSVGGVMDVTIKQLGATPVSVPTPEIYEATQRGIVDGIFTVYATAKGNHIEEVVKYATIGANFGAAPLTYLINEKKWNSLPEDVKNALQKAGEEASRKIAAAYDQQQVDLVKDFESKGVSIYRFTENDREKAKKIVENVATFWVEDMEKRGFPGKKVYEEFQKVSQEVARSK